MVVNLGDNMTIRKQIWKCGVCGNVVEVLSPRDDSGEPHKGADALVCCGVPMNSMDAKELEEGNEKHKLVVEADGEGVVVKVGSVPHPMEEGHYIEWVEGTSSGGEVCKKFLVAGDLPEVEFLFDVVSARCYCNLHGLWKS